MSTNLDSARQFFEACETGKGWEGCDVFCHPGATFSSQTTVLSDVITLEGYCEWMKNLLTPIPDGHYELKFFAADETRNSVAAFGVFHGTQTGPGGPRGSVDSVAISLPEPRPLNTVGPVPDPTETFPVNHP